MGFDIKIYGCIHNKKTQMLIHTVNGVDHDCDRVVFLLALRFMLFNTHVIRQHEPPFTFKASDQHDGMPNTFNFDWVVTRGGVIGGGQSKAQGSGPISWGCQCILAMQKPTVA